jgi:hypothetical protein
MLKGGGAFHQIRLSKKVANFFSRRKDFQDVLDKGLD